MKDLKSIESALLKKEIPKFNVGDTVKIMVKIPEGPDKTRLHPFEGLVIAKKGSGLRENFTVRKVSYGEGIERVFPLHSPNIQSVKVLRSGKVKRAKLYYLRGKIGKHATKIESKEKNSN
ncbi:MAG: 50S ribosomal protein L19 [Candidatus Omnitrophota bacterium]